MVVHALRAEPNAADRDEPEGRRDHASSVVGFVVSKSVGSAVRRNRVRRRLRHLCRQHLGTLAQPTLLVVRALPPAATAGVELADDLDSAWAAALVKLGRAHRPEPAMKPERR